MKMESLSGLLIEGLQEAPAGMLGFEALDFSDVPIAKFYFAVKTRSGAQKSNNHLRAFLLLCCHL
jgi:hypothetical protein